jgi:hypothetical protein
MTSSPAGDEEMEMSMDVSSPLDDGQFSDSEMFDGLDRLLSRYDRNPGAYSHTFERLMAD